MLHQVDELGDLAVRSVQPAIADQGRRHRGRGRHRRLGDRPGLVPRGRHGEQHLDRRRMVLPQGGDQVVPQPRLRPMQRLQDGGGQEGAGQRHHPAEPADRPRRQQRGHRPGQGQQGTEQPHGFNHG